MNKTIWVYGDISAIVDVKSDGSAIVTTYHSSKKRATNAFIVMCGADVKSVLHSLGFEGHPYQDPTP